MVEHVRILDRLVVALVQDVLEVGTSHAGQAGLRTVAITNLVEENRGTCQ